MVKNHPTRRELFARRGAILLELVVALGLLGAACIPIAYSFTHEKKLARAYYNRAIAMELVDGEMESLAAGEWKTFHEGEQPYPVNAQSAANLPPGRFELTLHGRHIRLEWIPQNAGTGGRVARETSVP